MESFLWLNEAFLSCLFLKYHFSCNGTIPIDSTLSCRSILWMTETIWIFQNWNVCDHSSLIKPCSGILPGLVFFSQSIYWGKSELQLIKSKFKSYLCKTLMFSPAVYVFKHHLNLFPVLNNQYFSFWIRMLLQSTPGASIVLWEISSHSSLELPTLFFSQRGNTFLLPWPGNSSSEKQRYSLLCSHSSLQL